MVFFYVSGHGFGHAIRQIEIINALSALDGSIPITVRTSAPRWLFERTARARYTLIEAEVDTGVVQRDSLTLDEAKTIERAAMFYGDLQRLAGEEAALLRRHRATIVVSDAPPLACAAAASAGVPSAVCANFTWDWIYATYAEYLHLAPQLLPAVRDAYALAAAGWRMPMHGGFETVPAIVELPFVARQPRTDRTPDDIRRALGLPADRQLALVSFGGYGVEGLPLERLDCTASWSIVVTGVTGVTGVRSRFSNSTRSSLENRDRTPIIALDESTIYSEGLRYADVVRAVDVVVTKPGYGIISDCVANGTAILYTSRGRFAEYDVLVSEMPRYLRCRYIDRKAFGEGQWLDALDALVASPVPPERPRVDGARVVAELIARYV